MRADVFSDRRVVPIVVQRHLPRAEDEIRGDVFKGGLGVTGWDHTAFLAAACDQDQSQKG